MSSGTTLPMPASEISMALGGASSGGGRLYDMSSSTTTSASAPATTSNNSPQNGFYTDADLSSGMEFGGYGVPMADREAMLRHFAPVLQDGHIGVDQDTMMMWSTMPSTYETQDWVTYMSSMLDLAHSNVDPAASTNGSIVGTDTPM